jgi:hypothetical protein
MKKIILSLTLSAIGVLTLMKCEKPEIEIEAPPAISEKVASDDLNSSTKNAPSNARIAFATDWSKKVHIVITEGKSFGHHTHAIANVPDDYVLIGGGASISPGQGVPGALLTGSYPDINKKTWHAEAKDHIKPFPHTLKAYAVGLKLDGIAKSELEKLITIKSSTSAVANHPELRVSFEDNNEIVLIGGGARVNWTGAGNMLVYSGPSPSQGWYAKAKDHINANPASITVYAIGIKGDPNSRQFIAYKSIIPGFGKLLIHPMAGVTSINPGGGYISAACSADNGWVLGCPGAGEIAGQQPALRMLTDIIPSIDILGRTSLKVYTKDHEVRAGGKVSAMSVQIQKFWEN